MNGIESDIIENKHKIQRNTDFIQLNKEAIAELKSDKYVPLSMFQGIINGYVHTIRRLIIAVCIIAVVLFVSNVIWIIMWSGRTETTIITNDGTSNMIGNDGAIK